MNSSVHRYGQRSWLAVVWSWIRGLLALAGVCALVPIVLAFTNLPWKTYKWMGVDPVPLMVEPDYIVMMGGGGIPSESGLIRSYETAVAALCFSNAVVIVAMTEEDDEATSSTKKVMNELMMRGVTVNRLQVEGKGRSTREQALNVHQMLKDERDPVVMIVTSPEHLKRSMLAFQKAGLRNVHGKSTFGVSVNADLRYVSDTQGETRVPVPDLGGNLFIRYQIWNNLSIEGKVARESAAMFYYWMKGWI